METTCDLETDDYRDFFYSKYVSSFKGLDGIPDYSFTDQKLIPLLAPWTQHLSRSARCLDLGCGHGNILHALRTLGFTNVEGVDLSAEQVVLARRMFPSVEEMSLTDKLQRSPVQHYNLILLFDVVEHLKKLEVLRLFDLLISRLAADGLLIIHCPNGMSPFVGSIRYGDFTHETVLTPQSARNLCSRFDLVDFQAVEHLGASKSIVGYARRIMWAALRSMFIIADLVETGSAKQRVYTRNFAFKARRRNATDLMAADRGK